jgi:hypothetical protein
MGHMKCIPNWSDSEFRLVRVWYLGGIQNVAFYPNKSFFLIRTWLRQHLQFVHDEKFHHLSPEGVKQNLQKCRTTHPKGIKKRGF